LIRWVSRFTSETGRDPRSPCPHLWFLSFVGFSIVALRSNLSSLGLPSQGIQLSHIRTPFSLIYGPHFLNISDDKHQNKIKITKEKNEEVNMDKTSTYKIKITKEKNEEVNLDKTST
jgi:hypothetical protein